MTQLSSVSTALEWRRIPVADDVIRSMFMSGTDITNDCDAALIEFVSSALLETALTRQLDPGPASKRRVWALLEGLLSPCPTSSEYWSERVLSNERHDNP